MRTPVYPPQMRGFPVPFARHRLRVRRPSLNVDNQIRVRRRDSRWKTRSEQEEPGHAGRYVFQSAPVHFAA